MRSSSARGRQGHRLEFAEGEFALDVTLQMNVQPGIYLIDISVIDRATEKQLNRAPSLNVRVTPGADFLGAINLNSIMKLSSVGAPPTCMIPGSKETPNHSGV